jgi:hypothetical protein
MFGSFSALMKFGGWIWVLSVVVMLCGIKFVDAESCAAQGCEDRVIEKGSSYYIYVNNIHGCFCDVGCTERVDCCVDYRTKCAGHPNSPDDSKKLMWKMMQGQDTQPDPGFKWKQMRCCG